MASEERKPAGPSVCRYCSTACTRDITSVYLNYGREEIYSKMLSETFNIVVFSESKYEDVFSYLICSKCITRLRDAVKFKKMVLECELVLEQYLQQLDFESPNVTGLDIVGEVVEDLAVDELLNDIKDEVEQAPLFDDDATDCEDESYNQLEDIIILKVEPVIEESTHKTRKRKATQNINLRGPRTRCKKMKIEDSLKTVSKSENKIIVDTNVYDQPADIIIPKEETNIEESEHKSRKRKVTRNIKSKEPQTLSKKTKTNDSLKAVSKSTKNKRKRSKHNKVNVVVPDAALVNARLIVKNVTVYPFKVSKTDKIGCIYCKEKFHTKHSEHFRTHIDTVHKNLDDTTAIAVSPYFRLIRADVSNLSCRICSQTLHTIEAAATHLKEEHALTIDLNESLGLVPVKLDSDQFDCIVCGSKFNGLFQVSRHTGSHIALNICPVCGKKMHSRAGHCSHSSTDRVFCTGCKQSFGSLDARRLHYKTSKSCLPCKCRYCGERFINRASIQQHQVEAHGRPEKSYACTQCDVSFSYQSMLTKHFNSTHTDFYKCQQCHERFWSNVSLQNHVARIHTLEKAYKCDFCECSYFEKRLLRSHMRIHDDNKKYNCDICGKKFVRRYILRDHIVKSHPGASVEDMLIKASK